MSKRSKRFQEAIEATKRNQLIEHLDMGGYPPATTPKDAIDLDWMAVLTIGTSDVAEALRYTAPEDERERRRLVRKGLALIVATAEEWENRI
jgi:hypothetical protein